MVTQLSPSQMAISPESLPGNPIDFRAPPPSPIASGRRSSVANDEVLTEFLEHSLRVPDLILPDRVFPQQKSIQSPPRISFQSLSSLENDSVTKLLDSIAGTGCVQLVDHGISSAAIRSVLTAGARIFQISPENKVLLSRSNEKPFGFEELHGDEEKEMNEEFVWGNDESFKLEMEGIWPLGYSNFSKQMERLSRDMQKVAGKVVLVLEETGTLKASTFRNGVAEGEELPDSICYLYNHRKGTSEERWANSLRYDVIRMLIRGSDYPHALCCHVCDGCSEFHLYSKKGWVSFCPDRGSLLITTGDQIQAWSSGQYKHVIGRPIFKGDDEDRISMAFLCSPPSLNEFKTVREKTVSLGQQAVVAMILTLVYHFLAFIYKQF